MSTKKCPKCLSSEHFVNIGISGTSLICECGKVVEFQFDIEAAPLFDTYEEAEEYAKNRSFSLLID